MVGNAGVKDCFVVISENISPELITSHRYLKFYRDVRILKLVTLPGQFLFALSSKASIRAKADPFRMTKVAV